LAGGFGSLPSFLFKAEIRKGKVIFGDKGHRKEGGIIDK
jgi:hypothetical protein